MTNDDHNIAPEDALRLMEEGRAVLIDVREEGEYRAEHIAGAHLVPGSSFDPAAVEQAAGDKIVIFQCAKGPRADQARSYFMALTGREALCLAGSMQGWKQAGLPVRSGDDEGV